MDITHVENQPPTDMTPRGEETDEQRSARIQALFDEIDAHLADVPRLPWPKDDPIVEKFRAQRLDRLIALDASALYGVVERDERRSKFTRRFLRETRGPFATTEACLTEAMYLAVSRLRWKGQEDLWRIVDGFDVQIASPSIAIVQGLMRRYRDVLMDFVDATLVALASEDPQVRIATFDSDFLAYRGEDGLPVSLVDDRLLGWE